MVKLDKNLAQEILNFLAQCPYAKVAHLVGPLMEQANASLEQEKLESTKNTEK